MGNRDSLAPMSKEELANTEINGFNSDSGAGGLDSQFESQAQEQVQQMQQPQQPPMQQASMQQQQQMQQPPMQQASMQQPQQQCSNHLCNKHLWNNLK